GRCAPVLCSCLYFLSMRRQPRSPLFPYTTLFRSSGPGQRGTADARALPRERPSVGQTSGRRVEIWGVEPRFDPLAGRRQRRSPRSEEHTSELQSRENLVCRLLLEKKKNRQVNNNV